jgi:predicted nuclease of predicted toxin-antitoxin system
MKLLLDQNLSPRLAARLADIYSHSAHVSALGLEQADDRAVWDRARREGYILVSKDADFSEMGLLLS